MKKIFAFALLLTTLACHKSNNGGAEKIKDKAGSQQITGKWELRKATGGIVPLIEYAPGMGRVWEFNTSNMYVFL